LGDEYTGRLRQLYDGRVPGGADLVTYWFEKARAELEAGKAQRAGLVATNSIRGGANRKVLERIRESTRIFAAWSDEPWVNEGAAVRVSLVCFGESADGAMLDGQPVAEIYADLTGGALDAGGAVDLTQARPLRENMGIMFMGASKKGSLDITGQLARTWLQKAGNPNGRPNSDVLFPLWNAIDVARRPRDMWVVDFGTEMSEAEAALYENPFEYVLKKVKPERENNRDAIVREHWWRFGRPRVEMRDALRVLSRYIVTPAVAKYRLFVWAEAGILPDQALLAAARSDDATFGILHCRFHELWALRLGTSLEDRPRYTPTTCFETFPFPQGILADPDPDARFPAIAETARRLNALRQNWLNPPEWVERVPEIVPGYPDRLIPKPEFAAELNRRTLTNLYNARPAWLDQAHRQLDEAVAAAYGWDDYQPAMPDAEILRRLLALNRQLANGFEGDSRD
jgi:type II restriction/modification system DNA methylase subunit YeeA